MNNSYDRLLDLVVEGRKDEGALFDRLKAMAKAFRNRRDAESSSSNIRNSGGATEPSTPHIAPAKSKQSKFRR